MTLPVTETLPQGAFIDARPMADAATFLLDGQQAAINAVHKATPAITTAAQQMAIAVRAGNDLHYAAAGSSGLMALADASELRGTFGIPSEKTHIHMPGGVPIDGYMPGDTEDDGAAAQALAKQVLEGDVVIVLTASGTTPFALEAARTAQQKGAHVIGIANNPGTPLLDLADTPICLATPPEVIAGSTRLGAGTAQKAALNLMSSLMGMALGHVYHGEMVNVIADNAKLIRRAAGMVARITGVSSKAAEDALTQAKGRVKPAILIAAGCAPDLADPLLDSNSGQLGPCLNALSSNQTLSSN